MKRFFVVLFLCGAITPPLLAGPVFTPSKSDLLSFNRLLGPGTFYGSTDDPALYDGGRPMGGEVGYWGQLSGSGAWIAIGSMTWDISGHDAYALYLYNDNDDPWTVDLGMRIAGSDHFSSATTLISGDSVLISWDISGIAGLDSVQALGFRVTNVRSDTDTFHVSASPVPAPGAVLLASIGAGLVGWLRRRGL